MVQLPVDDIPDEILVCARQLENEIVLDEEHDTYVPLDGDFQVTSEEDAEDVEEQVLTEGKHLQMPWSK